MTTITETLIAERSFSAAQTLIEIELLKSVDEQIVEWGVQIVAPNGEYDELWCDSEERAREVYSNPPIDRIEQWVREGFSSFDVLI